MRARPPYEKEEFIKGNNISMFDGGGMGLNPDLSRPHTHTTLATIPKPPLPPHALTAWRSPLLADRVNRSKINASFLSSVNVAFSFVKTAKLTCPSRSSSYDSLRNLRISSDSLESRESDGVPSVSVRGTARDRESEGF